MIFQGEIRQGVVVLPPDVRLPEGTRVTIELMVTPNVPPPAPSSSLIVRNGVPIFRPVDGESSSTIDLVNRLRDESP